MQLCAGNNCERLSPTRCPYPSYQRTKEQRENRGSENTRRNLWSRARDSTRMFRRKDRPHGMRDFGSIRLTDFRKQEGFSFFLEEHEKNDPFDLDSVGVRMTWNDFFQSRINHESEEHGSTLSNAQRGADSKSLFFIQFGQHFQASHTIPFHLCPATVDT